MKRINAAIASPMSRALANSAGLWLMPPRQRTNSIADGQSRAITWASWPAPDGSRIGVWPSSVTLAASASCSAGAQCAVAISWNGSMATFSPRALAMRDASAVKRSVAATRSASVSDAQIDREQHAAGDDVDGARASPRCGRRCRPCRPRDARARSSPAPAPSRPRRHRHRGADSSARCRRGRPRRSR